MLHQNQNLLTPNKIPVSYYGKYLTCFGWNMCYFLPILELSVVSAALFLYVFHPIIIVLAQVMWSGIVPVVHKIDSLALLWNLWSSVSSFSHACTSSWLLPWSIICVSSHNSSGMSVLPSLMSMLMIAINSARVACLI